MRMGRHLVGTIYVVEAKKEAVTEFWAAATLREDAVAAVEKELGPGWIVSLTDRRLTGHRRSQLKMHPNSVRKLGSRNAYRLLQAEEAPAGGDWGFKDGRRG
jgi:hypothetical protein